MSRSYKKYPVIKDGGKSKKFWKKLSNNILKQHDVASGCAYKRLVEQYSFCDYRWNLLGDSKNDWYYNGSSRYGGDWDDDMFKLTRK